MYWTRVKDRCLWRGRIPVVLFSYCFSSVAMNASGSNSAPGGMSMAIEKIMGYDFLSAMPLICV